MGELERGAGSMKTLKGVLLVHFHSACNIFLVSTKKPIFPPEGGDLKYSIQVSLGEMEID